jgi:uncharacterized protein (TIGR03083 family)
VTDRKQALRERMEESRAALDAAIRRMGDDEWDRPTSNPEWTAREILTHLAIAEPGLLARMRRILAGTSQLPPGFDLNTYNQRQVGKRRGEAIPALRAALGESRAQIMCFLDELADQELDIRGWHADGREVSLRDMFAILADHEAAHAKDLLTARVA